jgi:hypothetical protein
MRERHIRARTRPTDQLQTKKQVSLCRNVMVRERFRQKEPFRQNRSSLGEFLSWNSQKKSRFLCCLNGASVPRKIPPASARAWDDCRICNTAGGSPSMIPRRLDPSMPHRPARPNHQPNKSLS